MSTNYHFVCHDCKIGIHVAHDGFSGWAFYRGEPECMKALGTFLDEHKQHKIAMEPEHHFDDHDPAYAEVEWQSGIKST